MGQCEQSHGRRYRLYCSSYGSYSSGLSDLSLSTEVIYGLGSADHYYLSDDMSTLGLRIGRLGIEFGVI